MMQAIKSYARGAHLVMLRRPDGVLDGEVAPWTFHLTGGLVLGAPRS